MDFSTIILGVILILLIYICKKLLRIKHGNLPPERRGLPIIGNWEIVKRNPRTLRAFGAICTVRLFGSNFVLINDWKIFKEALIGQADVFAGRNRTFVMDKVNNHQGDTSLHLAKLMQLISNLVTIDGPVWKEKRRLAIHALRNLGFGKTTMEDMILDELSQVKKIVQMSNGTPLKITGLFFTPTLNISWGLISGKKYQYDDDFIHRLSYLVKCRLDFFCTTVPLNALPLLRMLPKDPFDYWKLLQISSEMTSFINAVVDEHVAKFQAESEPRDLVDAYLAEIIKRNISTSNSDEKQTAPYNREHLIGTMKSFLVAGIDTISSTLEWSFLYMALWPEIQRKVQAELDTIIGHDRLIQYADAVRLPYTEATLMEVHRYGPIAPLSLPHRTTSATKLATYTIPQNTTILTNIWAIHHDKELWGDPEVFRPERFLDANGKIVKPDYWVPFSIGPRSCPGVPLARMQLFLFFATLLQHFSFNYVTGEAPPSLTPAAFQSTTVAPRPFRLTIKQR